MSYLDYARTERQTEIAKLLDEGMTAGKIAAEVGRDEGSVRRTIRELKGRATGRGESPEYQINRKVPDGYKLKGISDMRTNEEGKPIWYKFSEDRERQHELMQEAIAALSEDLPRLPAVSAKPESDQNLLAVYPLGDPHIGVLCWGEETGQDWDLKIAEEKFCAVFDRLVKTAPHCEHAVIVNLGDYFHSDNLEGITTRSGHHLDMDGRFAKMVRIGIKIMRQMVCSALQHHKTVRVINATGNHDDTSSMFLAGAMAVMYEDEPRVTIDDAPTPYHYVEWGQCMFGVHHGHSCKPDRLPGVMASDQAEMWGRTKYRYWYTGHIHHDTKKEFAGVTQESFRTLAAKDAYATWGGYRSGQDSKCIVLHKEYGEVERHTVNLAMI